MASLDINLYMEKVSMKDWSSSSILLAEALSLPEYRTSPTSAFTMDLISKMLSELKSKGFTASKLQVCIALARELLDSVAEGNDFDTCKKAFEANLLSKAKAHPSQDDDKLSPNAIAELASFFTQSFFKHYNLYQYCFTKEQQHEEAKTIQEVETPWIHSSLDLALNQEEWDAWCQAEEEIAQKKIQEEEEKREAEEARIKEEARLKAEEEQVAEQERKLNEPPKTFEDAVGYAVTTRVAEEKVKIAAEYKAKEEVLLQSIKTLEDKLNAA